MPANSYGSSRVELSHEWIKLSHAVATMNVSLTWNNTNQYLVSAAVVELTFTINNNN